MLGSHEIDSAAVEQIVSEAQLRTLGEALVFLWRSLSERPGRGAPIPELLDRVARAIDERGLDALVSEPHGDLVAFRRHELAAVLNRIRGLRMETT
jgi:hypothetical protein